MEILKISIFRIADHRSVVGSSSFLRQSSSFFLEIPNLGRMSMLVQDLKSRFLKIVFLSEKSFVLEKFIKNTNREPTLKCDTAFEPPSQGVYRAESAVLRNNFLIQKKIKNSPRLRLFWKFCEEPKF